MKKILLSTIIIFTCFLSFSQDTITKTNHEIIFADIIKISDIYIEYFYQNDTIIHCIRKDDTQQINFSSNRIQEFNTKQNFEYGYTKGYRFIFELAIGRKNTNQIYPTISYLYKLSITNGYQFNKYFFAGINLGCVQYFHCEDASLLGEAAIQINFLDAKLSPYLNLSCGMSSLYYSDPRYSTIANKNISFNGGLGIQYHFRDRIMVNYGLNVATLPTAFFGKYENNLCVFINIGISAW